jgi:hypothetical protein
VNKECEGHGAIVGTKGNRIEFIVQADADDVVSISKEVNGVRSMLQVVENVVQWSQVEVNVKKCETASDLNDVHRHRHRHRSSLAENLKFKNQAIPNLTLAQSLKYLGTAVAPR